LWRRGEERRERGRDLGGESVSLLLFLRASPLIKAM
jgi:hypothetical protein